MRFLAAVLLIGAAAYTALIIPFSPRRHPLGITRTGVPPHADH